MPSIRFLTLPILVISLIGGCDSMELTGSPEVRVENASASDFEHVSFYAGATEHSYPGLGRGESTPYVVAERPYSYTTIVVVVDGDTLRQQVIDFVGETPLSPGRYTYVLTLSDASGSRDLSQALRRDP